MHYYQFHIGDYKSHTSHLTVIEDCAYRRLLDFYYLNEKPINQRDVARQINMREYEQDVLTILNEFFISNQEGFINPRADKEIAKYKEFAEAGKRGAAKRWATLPNQEANGEANSPPNATPIATNNHKPITINHKPKVESTRGSRLSTDFFYPKEWADFCHQERPDLNIQKTFEIFKDYWVAKAGQQGVKLDWFATWRNWVRSQNQAPVNKADQVFTTVPSKFERDPALVAVEQKLKEAVPMPPEIREYMARLHK